jgi:serine/threonine protein kinase/tetratricopeptide (TPR) repeat protein
MSDHLPAVESVFGAALEIPSPEGRASFLDRVCGGNAELRREIESLLEAHFRAGQFLESPAATPTVTVTPAPPVEEAGTLIGPYKLLEPIGEGGMGVVYMAEQTRPIRRKVALKIIKPGMDTKQVIARFEAERQALALMDHPNIARVLDGGTTESGRPYFVMELVRGIPITDYCDREKLSIRDRVELFVHVCQAVQHAHQKGIIHRDLKPSNVMVTMIDGAAVPRVIDFGVAKAMGPQLTERTLFTGFAQLIGTPLYMSPEQAEFSGVDVDTRSDIYSLGVLLYELLTGTTPFDRETFRRAAYDEIRRIIREEEPPRPSTRISTLEATAAAAEVSGNRQTVPRALRKLMRGELDWIVMKALDKDRNRRYETASGLAADLRHYLGGEAVQACPPSSWYRLSKYARRNRTVLATAAVVAAALLAGTAVSAWQAIRATDAERLAGTRLEGERKARGEADRLLGEVTRERNQAYLARQEADQSAAEAMAVVAFVVDDVLGAAAPSKTRGKAVTVLEALANADRAMEGKFAKEPRVEASVRQALASVYQELGEYEKALGQARRALAIREETLGPEHEDTLAAMHTFGWTYFLIGKAENDQEAEELYRRMLDTSQRTRGAEDELTLTATRGLAAILWRRAKYVEARALSRRVLGVLRRTKGPEHPATLSAMDSLARHLINLGQLTEPAALLREVVEIESKNEPDNPLTLVPMDNYLLILPTLSRTSVPDEWALRSMNSHLRVLTLKHPRTLATVGNAARLKCAAGRPDEALAIVDRVIDQAKREFGLDDAKTAILMMIRVSVLRDLGDLSEASSTAEKALAARTRTLGPDDPGTFESLAALADLRRFQGANEEASKLFARLAASVRRVKDAGKWRSRPNDRYGLDGEIIWAERLAATLVQPGRSDRSRIPPGQPGGPPRIDAPFQTASPVADGRIEPGEYGDGEGFSFDFSRDPNPAGSYLHISDDLKPQELKDPADLSVEMHAVHTSRALYLAFRVRDQVIKADPTKPIWENDYLQVYLDGDGVANDMTPTAQGWGDREGFVVQADVLGQPDDPRWKTGADRTEDGYVIEFVIPLDGIDTQDGPGYRPAATGSELRFNVNLMDFDDAQSNLLSYALMWCEDRRAWSLSHGGEDFWSAKLRLTPSPAVSESLPADTFAPP